MSLLIVLVFIFTLSSLYPCCCSFFFQAEDGIRDLVRSRGLGDVYKRQVGVFLLWVTVVDNWRQLLGFLVNQKERWRSDPYLLSLIHI